MSIPPPNAGEAHRSWTSSGVRAWYSSSTPTFVAASIVPSHRPSALGLVATARSPPLREPRVDAVGLAPRADLGGGAPARHEQLERIRLAVGGDHVADVPPPAVAEAAVAAARPAAADVGLEQHDVEVRVALLQEPRGPHPRVAAAEDHDVGGRVPRSGGASGPANSGMREGLLEPPRSLRGPGCDGHGRCSFRLRTGVWIRS